jgi:hypothetical protein
VSKSNSHACYWDGNASPLRRNRVRVRIRIRRVGIRIRRVGVRVRRVRVRVGLEGLGLGVLGLEGEGASASLQRHLSLAGTGKLKLILQYPLFHEDLCRGSYI